MKKISDEKLADFLMGASLSIEEQILICSEIRENPDLRKSIDYLSGFEASLQQLAWAGSIDGEDQQNTWAQICVPEEEIKKDCKNGQDLFSVDEWHSIIDKSLKVANETTCSDSKKQTIAFYDFRKWKTLLAAACLLGAFMFSTKLFISNFFSVKNHTSAFIAINNKRNCDSLHIKTSCSKAVPKDTLLMEKATKMIMDRGASVSELAKKDSLVILTVSRGTIDFSVEKKRYRSFIVVTPYARIIVTGTAFRVTSGDNFTYLKVTEGSVRVEHTVKNLVRNVVAGDEVIANADELIKVMVDSCRILSSSNHTAADYLKINPAESFVDPRDSLSVIYRGFLAKIIGGKPFDEPSMNKFVNDNHNEPWLKSLYIAMSERYEKEGNLNKSIELLDSVINSDAPQIYKDNCFYRKFILLSKENECEKALSLSDTYMNTYPQGSQRNEFALLSMRLSFRSKNLNSGKIYNHLINLNPPLTNQDIITIEYADSLRMAGTESDSLLSLYESVVEKYPHSCKLSDAAYWAAWCLVQKSIIKQEKHVFTNRMVHPGGNRLLYDQGNP